MAAASEADLEMAADEVGAAGPGPAAPSRKGTSRKGAKRPAQSRRRGWGRTGWAAILAAVVFLGWSGWSAWAAWRDAEEAGAAGHDREVVLKAARGHIGVLNTLDRGRADAGLRAWQAASTGALLDQLRRDEPQAREKIRTSRTSAAGTVTGAAVTSLDEDKAEVIASVQVALTPQGGTRSVQLKRFEAGLTRTPAGWKLTSLTAIPAGAR